MKRSIPVCIVDIRLNDTSLWEENQYHIQVAALAGKVQRSHIILPPGVQLDNNINTKFMVIDTGEVKYE